MTKAFLSCAIVAAGLLAATSVMALDSEDPLDYTSCGRAEFGSTVWRSITVSEGPCATQCGDPPDSGLVCDPDGACTGIEYTVESAQTLAHVAVLAKGGVSGTNPANADANPCVGDSVTGLGVYSCHEQAIRTNPNDQTETFAVVVWGNREPIITSIAAKKGGKIGSCRITGVGGPIVQTSSACVASCGDFDPKQGIIKEVIFQWQDCVLKQTFDADTGDFLGGDVVSGPCSADVPLGPVSDIFLDADVVTHADGSVSSGDDSCYTYFSGGVYCKWCR
jgi:hypothetical protein